MSPARPRPWFLLLPTLALLAAPFAAARADYPPRGYPPGGYEPADGPAVYLTAGAADVSASLEIESRCRWCEPWSNTGPSGTGYTLGVGVQLNRNVAFEVSHLDADEALWREPGVEVPGLAGLYDTDVALDLRATSVTLVGMLPIGPVELFARAGAARVEATSRQRVTDVLDGRVFTREFDARRTGFTAGLGAGLLLGENARIALEASLLPLDRALLAEVEGDASLVVLGLTFALRFGL